MSQACCTPLGTASCQLGKLLLTFDPSNLASQSTLSKLACMLVVVLAVLPQIPPQNKATICGPQTPPKTIIQQSYRVRLTIRPCSICVCVCVCAHTGHACHQSPDQLDPHVQDSSMQASPHHQHSYQGVYGMPPTAQHNPKVVIQSIISLTITQAARRLQSTHAQLTSACSKE